MMLHRLGFRVLLIVLCERGGFGFLKLIWYSPSCCFSLLLQRCLTFGIRANYDMLIQAKEKARCENLNSKWMSIPWNE
jgi:hypothetical protein